MPREHRKRGKKHKKQEEHAQIDATPSYRNPSHNEPENTQAGPSWIVSHTSSAEFNAEAPYGYVDSEVKAYFRTVDTQIREWQDGGHNSNGDADTDPNEGKLRFWIAN